jgi:hypothetical protein
MEMDEMDMNEIHVGSRRKSKMPLNYVIKYPTKTEDDWNMLSGQQQYEEKTLLAEDLINAGRYKIPRDWLETGVPDRTKWAWKMMSSNEQKSEIEKLPSNPLKNVVRDVNRLLTRTCNLSTLMMQHPQYPSLAHRF